MTPPVLKNYICGEWIASTSARTSANLNPADSREILAYSPHSTREETRTAIEAAAAAFPKWKATPAPVRGKMLFRALDLMRERSEELATMLTREEGKTLKDSRGEVQRALNILEFTAGEGRRLNGATIPSELASTFIYTIRQPIGVAGLLTPWNFPVAIPVWKIAPALLAGNTVVFKPASLTPLCAVIIAEILHAAGIPPGVFNLVLGSGSEVGNEIVNHQSVRALSFTGSNEIGCSLYEEGSRRGVRVQCEMGGKNPMIVLGDADLDLALSGAIQGGFGSTGQRCTATSRIIVEDAVAERFIERMLQAMEGIRVGSGMNAAVDMGPLVDESQLQTVLKYIDTGKSEGARLRKGGRRLTGDSYDRGYFVEPTLFDRVSGDMRIAQEEIFGPVVCILIAKDFEHAVNLANNVQFGLSASLYTQDMSKALKFVDLAEVGKVHINSPTIGGEAQAPFGGTKATGIGPREQGIEVFEFYTEIKTVYMDYTGKKRESSMY